jgi:hypothetical protein
MQQMMGQMAERIAASIPRPPSMMEQIQMLGALRAAMGPSDNGGNMQQFVAMLQVAKELVSNGGEPSELSSLVSLAKPFVETIAAKAQQSMATVPVGGPVPNANVLPGGESPDMVRSFLASLTTHAANNADVEPIADEIVNIVPPAALDEFLSAEDWYQRLIAIEPQAANHSLWFSRLYSALTSDNESVQDPATPPA